MRLYTMAEVGEVLHVRDPRTLRKLEARGLTPTWVGPRRLYSSDTVAAFVAANTKSRAARARRQRAAAGGVEPKRRYTAQKRGRNEKPSSFKYL